MERRKFLIGAGSAAVGASAVIGSGAFTSVSADRGVTVSTADDSAALLSIQREQNSENANEYVDVASEEGTVSLDFDGSDSDGLGNGNANGINRNAQTVFDDLLRITNRGTQDVIVGYRGEASDGSELTTKGFALYEEDDSLGGDTGEGILNLQRGAEKLPTLSPGETLNNVGAFFFGDVDVSTINGSNVTFVAAASADDF